MAQEFIALLEGSLLLLKLMGKVVDLGF